MARFRNHNAPLYHAPPPEPAMVRLVDLPPDRKRRLWAWIKANDPTLAAWLESLRTDPLVQAFDATPRLSLEYVRQAIG